MSTSDCPNPAGNGGLFAAGELGPGLSLLAFIWVLLVAVEQLLPWSRRGWHSLNYAVCAIGAPLTAFVLSCYFPFGLTMVCR